jgi:cytochrome b561
MKTYLVSRYHPLLVLLHWLFAALIVAMLCIGFMVLEPMPNIDPQKIDILLIHMSVGILIFALMVVRFVIRMRTSRPAPATTGFPVLPRCTCSRRSIISSSEGMGCCAECGSGAGR